MLWVDVEWPSLPSILVAKATACHLPSGLISPLWMTTSRSCSAALSLKKQNADTKKCLKVFKDWASARNHHSRSTIERVLNDILLTDTTLQLLKVWRVLSLLREHLEDLAILCRLIARYQLPTHSTIQTTHIFSGWLFWQTTYYTLSVACCVLYCTKPEGAKHPWVSCSNRNTLLKACSNYYLLCFAVLLS